MSTTRYRLLAIGVLVLTLALDLLVFVLPLPNVKDVAAVRWQTVAAIAASMTTIGATGLFLSGLRSFKTSLRVAYVLLASGLVLYSLALLQLPIVGFFGVWTELWWTKSGLLVVPFFLGIGMIYAGMRRFAMTLGIRNKSTSFLFVTAVAIAGTLVSYVFGHYFSVNRQSYDPGAYPATSAWIGVYCTFAMLLARTILQRIGPFYKNATWWLFVALMALTVGGWHQYVLTLAIDIRTAYFTYGISFVPLIVSGLVFLRAGYAFDLLSIDTSKAEGALAPVAREAEDSDYMDSIVAVSQLASRVEEIDPILDDLRAITATVSPGTQLPPESRQRLIVVYTKLESYLLHDDPLRNFTVEELRSKISPAFRDALERQTTGKI